jgi:quercetin dioxygenase-like cupin family protein
MHEDPTRVYSSSDRAWIPLPLIPKGEAWIKVIHADPNLHKVVFKFRFGPGSELPSHTHRCHAIAYTISGEWAYEGLDLPEGAIAYEPVESTHTPTSGPGAELAVVLDSEDDHFLVNHLPDGREVEFDMAFFQTLEGITPEAAEAMLDELDAATEPAEEPARK